jgi:hypothetical protein
LGTLASNDTTVRRSLTPHELAADCGASRLAGMGGRRPAATAVWPCLLVLDAGAFQARCRSCGWASPRQPALEAALATFEAHVCQEPSP